MKQFFNSNALDLQNQLEHVNKSIHESEKEMKRLENEQSQAAVLSSNSNEKSTNVAAPVAPTPTFVNAFTLEKLDNTDVRRFVSVKKKS